MQRVAIVRARDGKRVVNITTRITRAAQTFLDVSVEPFQLVCWKVIDAIFTVELVTQFVGC